MTHTMKVVTTDYLQCEVLKFCWCGRPVENILYIKEGLKLIEGKGEREFKEYEEDALKHFGTVDSMYFFCYWADGEKLTEHGSSVEASRLSYKGKDFLLSIELWIEELKNNGNGNS